MPLVQSFQEQFFSCDGALHTQNAMQRGGDRGDHGDSGACAGVRSRCLTDAVVAHCGGVRN